VLLYFFSHFVININLLNIVFLTSYFDTEQFLDFLMGVIYKFTYKILFKRAADKRRPGVFLTNTYVLVNVVNTRHV